jgi:hypothetical protein
MSVRRVILRRGRYVGWWVEGREATGRLFMQTWWPTERLARWVGRRIGRWTGAGEDPDIEETPPPDA